jgi:4'-phosphopantetheinyl transferase
MAMADASEWLIPPAELHFEPGELHVWRALEDDYPASLPFLYSLLAPDEKAHADEFRFDPDRHRFIFCRGVLRHLLARYTGKPAAAIEFTFGPFGKPALAGSQPPFFNLSHTRGISLFAFSMTMPVGIDVEAIDTQRDWSATARRFFHPAEWAFVESQPNPARNAAAYTIWTRKEACLKATGDGVGGGLETFEVVPADGADEARITLSGNPAIGEIFLRSLNVGPDFAAAVASIGRPSRLRSWRLQCFGNFNLTTPLPPQT